MAEAPRSSAPEERAPVAKSRKKLFAIGGAIVVLLAGAGFVVLARGEKAPVETESAETPAQPTVVTLEPFVLNLADEESERFLRIAIHVILDRPEASAGADGLAG